MSRVMALVMGCFPFDCCEAWDTELRVWSDFEPLIGNILMTVAALSVVLCAHELQRLFDMSKPFKGPDFHQHGDVMFEIS